VGIWDGEMQEESKHFPDEITDSRLSSDGGEKSWSNGMLK